MQDLATALSGRAQSEASAAVATAASDASVALETSRPTNDELKSNQLTRSSASATAVTSVSSAAPALGEQVDSVGAASVMVAVAAASQFDTAALDQHGGFDPSSMSDVASQLQAASASALAATAAPGPAAGGATAAGAVAAATVTMDATGSNEASTNSQQQSALLRCSSPLNLPSSPTLFSTSPTSTKSSSAALANLSANMLSAEAALATINAAAEAAAEAAAAAAENDTMMANAAASVHSYFQNDADSVGTFTRELREFHRSVSELEESEKQLVGVDAHTEPHPAHGGDAVGGAGSLVATSRSSKKRKAGANASIDLQTKIRLIELAEEYQYDPRTSGRARGETGGPALSAKTDQMSGIRLAAQFGLNKSTVSRILKRKEEFKKAYYKDNVAGCSKHINKKSKFEKLNRLVENWFDVTREKKVAVSDTLIRDVGKRFAEELGIEDFRASNGWVRSLRNRKEHQARNMSLEALERERMKKDAEAIERMRNCFPNGAKDLAAFFKDLAIFLEKGNELLMGSGTSSAVTSTSSSSCSSSSSSTNCTGINGNHLVLMPQQPTPAVAPSPQPILAPDVTVPGLPGVETSLGATDDSELVVDDNHEESLKKRMIESLRSWSHELMETELAKLKKQLKPRQAPTLPTALL